MKRGETNWHRERARDQSDLEEISFVSVDDRRGDSPINRSFCRKMILNRLEVLRPALAGKLVQVSASSLDWLEARVQNLVDDALRRHPTIGSTIYLDR